MSLGLFVGGPLNGDLILIKAAYLDDEGKPLNTKEAERKRRSGKYGIYFNRGTHYEWKEQS